MNTVARHKIIIDKLNNEGQVKSTELCEALNVSSVTIRKDLMFLEEKGMLYRMHGGATSSNPYTSDRPVSEKEKISYAEKTLIATEAASRITPNDSILIASGTSVLALAKAIKPIGSLRVITSALNVAEEINKHMETEVYLLGGIMRKQSSSVVGLYAENVLKDFSCSKLFLGVDGVDLDFGFTNANASEASLNREMIKISQKTIVLVDSSKFGKRGFSRICDFESIDEIITDNKISNYMKKELENRGIEVTIV